jgi:hypothetical protein
VISTSLPSSQIGGATGVGTRRMGHDEGRSLCQTRVGLLGGPRCTGRSRRLRPSRGLSVGQEVHFESHPYSALAGNRVNITSIHYRHYSTLLSRKCAKVRTVLFLPRRFLKTAFVSDRRDFPDYDGDRPRRSAAIAGRTRHG